MTMIMFDDNYWVCKCEVCGEWVDNNGWRIKNNYCFRTVDYFDKLYKEGNICDTNITICKVSNYQNYFKTKEG